MDSNINIFIGGDFCPIGRNVKTIVEKEFGALFGGMAKCASGTDLKILNMESPLTISVSPITKSGPNIKAIPEAAEALSYIGINLVTLANNHIMDYGKEGLLSTLGICREKDIATVGAGMNREEARKPFLFQKGGKKIAVLNFAENEYNQFGESSPGANVVDLISNFNDIKKCKSNVDVVMVICHGGREHYQLPTPRQRQRYRFYADAGADVIVGHHSHCYSGYEIYNETPIFYSLGNFIFDYKKKYQKGLWTEAFAIHLCIGTEALDFKLIPFFQGRKENPNIHLMDNDDRRDFFDKIGLLNRIITDDQLFFDNWNNYLNTQRKYYLSMLNTSNKYVRYLKAKGLFPELRPFREHRNILLNILRCETHHEIMTDILEKTYLENER
jgi:Putative enzyme of poly-gamma-glutamate biosynthesis (capsule formation)